MSIYTQSLIERCGFRDFGLGFLVDFDSGGFPDAGFAGHEVILG